MLNIETYNLEWRDALRDCGYSQYAAFQTSTFEAFGFPTEVKTEPELLRYVDFFAGEDLPERLEAGRFFRSSGLTTDFSIDEVALLSKIARRNGLVELSMGMSSDYENAIINGSTYLRLGTAILGERNTR